MSLTTTLAPAGGMSLVPSNMGEAMQLADMMAKTGFLARELQTPGGALFVVEQSMRWQMSPYAVAMETSFIQGKPMFSGKIVGAAVVSTRAIEGRLSYEYSGKGDDRAVVVRGMVRGESQPREVSVRLADAKTSNKVWVTQPDQQLAYHGNRVWARRHTPEVMLGVWSPEEMDDAPAPMPPARGPVLDAERPPAQAEPDLITRTPAGEERGAPSVAHWLKWSLAFIEKLEDAAAVKAWLAAMEPHMEAAPLDAARQVQAAAEARMDHLDSVAGA